MIIDLRSDTVTKPSKEMIEAMMKAKVGDDVFDEDPTIKQLEQKIAAIFGKEDAIFCPSGTMTNQIAIKILSQPQQELICDKLSHIYLHEGGGVAFNSGLSMRLLNGDRGRIRAIDVEENINPDQVYLPETALVSLENTCNKGGGSCYKLNEIQEIRSVCIKHNIKLHLDGARIFNALTNTGDTSVEMGKCFDTISVCFSKGLGAPVGSALISDTFHIKKARRVRKVFGGGMRQSGFLAAAAIFALDNNRQGLKNDHDRAKIIEKELKKISYIREILPVETNIIVFKLDDKVDSTLFINVLKEKNILVAPFGKQLIRMVTHLDFTEIMLEKLIGELNSHVIRNI